jgi:hypothetical protein
MHITAKKPKTGQNSFYPVYEPWRRCGGEEPWFLKRFEHKPGAGTSERPEAAALKRIHVRRNFKVMHPAA